MHLCNLPPPLFPSGILAYVEYECASLTRDESQEHSRFNQIKKSTKSNQKELQEI